jgi:hypothetical protein
MKLYAVARVPGGDFIELSDGSVVEPLQWVDDECHEVEYDDETCTGVICQVGQRMCLIEFADVPTVTLH